MAWNDALTAQYMAATNGVGFLRLSGWTTLTVEGADRASFLHNMCTNDIRGLPIGGQCEAFLTDVKGKILGHVVVLAEPEQLTLVTVPGQAEKLIAHLDRYIIREDVRLADDSATVAWSLRVGPGEMEAIPGLTGDSRIRRSASGVVVAPCSLIWPGGDWVGVARGSGEDRAKPQAAGGVDIGAEVWHALRIESAWPLFGVDFDGSHLPQEVGRDAQAISFRKGCYLGQETIARIDALGHVNKRIATVQFAGDEPPPPGAELTADGQSAGLVTSSCWSPHLGAPVGLAMIRRGFNDPGVKFECGGQAAATISTPGVPHLTPAQ